MKSSIFVSVIVLTSQAFVQGAIVSDPPRNVTAVVGQNVTLTCQVEIGEGERDALNWEKITPGSSSTYIFKSIDPPEKTSNPNKYQIFGTFNLRILNVDVSDGGLYSCYLYLDSNTKYTANVIVLGQPNLEVTEQVNEGDQTTARCSAQFGSQPLKLLDKALLPHISLQVGQDVIVSNNTYTTVDLTNIVTAVSTSARFYGHHNEKDVRCVVKSSFRPYVSVYASQTIFVIYPARDISFDSVKPFYKVGDIIRCRANGRPSPSLRWVSVNTSQPIEGGLLAVTSNMVARKNIWNCTAWNTIGNVTYTVSNVATFSATSQGGSFRTTEFSIFSIAFCVYYFLN